MATTEEVVRRHVLDAINSGDLGPSFYNVDGIVAELISTYGLTATSVVVVRDESAQLLDIEPGAFMDVLDKHERGERLALDELGEAMRKMAEAAQQMAAALVEVSQAIRARHGAEEVPPGARLAIDATCPSCRYPERWYDLAREVFGCNWCSYTSILREA